MWQRPLVGHNDLLYFADICAGPGGFSEYVLWRRKHRTKGFGFTIKGPNDFKLEEFFAASPEYFEPHYGEILKLTKQSGYLLTVTIAVWGSQHPVDRLAKCSDNWLGL